MAAYRLFAYERLEEIRTMEVGLLDGYRKEGEEMGLVEEVAAFVDIGAERQPTERRYSMVPEGLGGDDEGEPPTGRGRLRLKGLATQRRPTGDARKDLCRGEFATIARGSPPHQHRSCGVTFYIIIAGIVELAKKLATRIFPHTAIVGWAGGSHLLFRHLKRHSERIFRVAQPHTDLGSIGIVGSPRGVGKGVPEGFVGLGGLGKAEFVAGRYIDKRYSHRSFG